MPDPKQAEPVVAKDLGRRMMNQALVISGMVFVVFYFVYTGKVAPDQPITLEVTTAQKAPAPDKTIPVAVSLKLSNNTKDGVSLSIPTQCDMFKWVLTDPAGEFVQAKGEGDNCPRTSVSTWLEGGKAMEEKFELMLDPQRVHPGDYKLHLRYWGHEQTQDLVIK
ncbi:MAG: hypothetical protein ACOH12_02925 [Parvibaculaceae bacterium]